MFISRGGRLDRFFLEMTACVVPFNDEVRCSNPAVVDFALKLVWCVPRIGGLFRCVPRKGGFVKCVPKTVGL